MLRGIWSHTRNIDVLSKGGLLIYNIPIYSEQGFIGGLRSVEINQYGMQLIFTELAEQNKKPVNSKWVLTTCPSPPTEQSGTGCIMHIRATATSIPTELN